MNVVRLASYLDITEGGCEWKEVGALGMVAGRGRGLRPGGTWRSRPWIVELYIMCRDISTVGNLYRSYNILERSGGALLGVSSIAVSDIAHVTIVSIVSSAIRTYSRASCNTMHRSIYDVSSTYMSPVIRYIRIEGEIRWNSNLSNSTKSIDVQRLMLKNRILFSLSSSIRFS